MLILFLFVLFCFLSFILNVLGRDWLPREEEKGEEGKEEEKRRKKKDGNKNRERKGWVTFFPVA